jgi:hypothetical protein
LGASSKPWPLPLLPLPLLPLRPPWSSAVAVAVVVGAVVVAVECVDVVEWWVGESSLARCVAVAWLDR